MLFLYLTSKKLESIALSPLSNHFNHFASHFDHLDPDAISELGDSCEWIVPVGCGPFLRKHGATRVTELEYVSAD